MKAEKGIFRATEILQSLLPSLLPLLMMALFLMSCTSTPRQVPVVFPPDTDVQAEINKIDEQLKMAGQEQLHVFAPNSFSKASKALEESRKGLEKNRDRRSLLGTLGEARFYTDRVFQRGEPVKKQLKDVAAARDEAIRAGALYLSKEELSQVDREFKDSTELIELNPEKDMRPKDRLELQSMYLDLELKTIKKDKLGAANHFLQAAKDAGSRVFAPETMLKAEEKYYSAEKVLEGARHDDQAYKKPIQEATAQARELLKITLTAKNAKSMTPEQVAMDIAAKEKSLEKSLEAARELQKRTFENGAHVAELDEQNKQLDKEQALDEKVKDISKRFTKNEAKIFRQGANLVVRLKSSKSFSSTLVKVNALIRELDSRNVTVEGKGATVNKSGQLEAVAAHAKNGITNIIIEPQVF